MKFFEPAGKADESGASASFLAGAEPSVARDIAAKVALKKGQVLNGYRIVKLISQDNFNFTYHAIEISTGLNVALREYFPQQFAIRNQDGQIVPVDGSRASEFEQGFRQFYNEMWALKALRHPNVPMLRRFFQANDSAYLVATNGTGRSLEWFISSNQGAMDQNLIYKIFLPVLSALNFLHAAQLLHLDIQPGNILLQPSGKTILKDFGAGQEIKSRKRIRQMQVFLHDFAPPEQRDANLLPGPWSDLYAVAATMYYCIVGEPPRQSKNMIRSGRNDISGFAARYSAALLSAIERCLRPDSAERYQSIDEFSAALLQGSSWKSLEDYEISEMDYNRSVLTGNNLRFIYQSFAA